MVMKTQFIYASNNMSYCLKKYANSIPIMILAGYSIWFRLWCEINGGWNYNTITA